MKKILLTLLMAFFILAVSVAQDSSRNHWKSLNLTEDQQNKMAALQKEHREKVMAVLTPEQRKQFEKQKLDMKARRMEKSPGRRKKMKSGQQLSPKQTVKLDKANQGVQQDSALVTANQRLAAAELNRQMKAQHEAGQTDSKAILDPSQQSILEEIKSRRQKPSGR